jgi:hypothetical protein
MQDCHIFVARLDVGYSVRRFILPPTTPVARGLVAGLRRLPHSTYSRRRGVLSRGQPRLSSGVFRWRTMEVQALPDSAQALTLEEVELAARTVMIYGIPWCVPL